MSENPESPPVQQNGRFLVLERADWQEAADSEWCVQEMYLFNGRETLVGVRNIRGRERNVYLCLNEEEYVAWVPDSESLGDAVPEESPDFLRFQGKNWKLAGDKKWKPTSFAHKHTLVGSRTVHGVERDVFREDGYDSYVVPLI